MNDSNQDAADLLRDLTVLDLYADGAPVALIVDEWGNEWEASTSADMVYRIVED